MENSLKNAGCRSPPRPEPKGNSRRILRFVPFCNIFSNYLQAAHLLRGLRPFAVKIFGLLARLALREFRGTCNRPIIQHPLLPRHRHRAPRKISAKSGPFGDIWDIFSTRITSNPAPLNRIAQTAPASVRANVPKLHRRDQEKKVRTQKKPRHRHAGARSPQICPAIHAAISFPPPIRVFTRCRLALAALRAAALRIRRVRPTVC